MNSQHFILSNDISSLSAKVLMNERQSTCLKECLRNLKYSADVKDNVLVVEQIKYALKALRKIRGEYYDIDEIYEKIFANFCIGK